MKRMLALAVAGGLMTGGSLFTFTAVADETTSEPTAPAAVTTYQTAKADWKKCVRDLVGVAATTGVAGNVLETCGEKPKPPGEAKGWKAAKVSKAAQKKVDRAAKKYAKQQAKTPEA